ncbi:TonB-dependent receptor [Sphingobium jiangsuense]|uniref:Outer membrane receptor protein involved in Fe transport n=1 Tax=Sphingobium jiangsuense TaxID=870476 RepID=A0A7W6BJ37_9SPHN|nr:TonB-dependent receptor [Sphingobium jiangsuense]MBB3925986.1 outer membrane receptor protein involved in Fe transport [Sphingobium jiangsuense]GLS98919.1 TonB-dependent receptor [Sphingobium jiangsuense]
MTLNKRGLRAVSWMMACSAPAMAAAQTQGATETADAYAAEIVVTAQHRQQTRQDVPISVAVTTGASLREAGTQTLEDFSLTTPGLQVSEGGNTNFLSLRGVSSGADAGFEQSLGTFVDNVYRGRARYTKGNFVDIQRVEVLRGPQSTFFGMNTIAGALNITTAKPGARNEGYANISFLPAFDEWNMEAATTVRASDTLGVRFAGRFNRSDGYIQNIFTNKDEPRSKDYFGRMTLLWEPSADFDATLRVEGGNTHEKGSVPAEILSCPPAAPFTPSVGCALSIGTPGFEDRLNHSLSRDPTFSDTDFGEAALTLNARLGGLTLTSVTAYTGYNFTNVFDLDNTSAASIFVPGATLFEANQRERYRQFSQEVRLTSPSGGTFEYIVGAYYQKGKIDWRNTLGLNFIPFATIPPLAGRIQPGEAVGQNFFNNQRDEVFSAFVSGTLHFGERARLNLGLRYTDVVKKLHKGEQTGLTNPFAASSLPYLDSFVPFTDPVTSAIVAGVLDIDLFDTNIRLRNDDWMPSASLQYDIADDVMAYASYANGFKAGGFSFATHTLGGDANGDGTISEQELYDPIAFEPEYVDAFELGLKAQWFDRRLTTNLALFHNSYSNLQKSLLVAGTSLTFVVGNAAKAVSKGAEFELDWRVTDRLRLGGSVSYLVSKYKDYPDAPPTALQTLNGIGAQDLAGRPTQRAPEWSGTVNASYVQPIGTLELKAATTLFFTDGYFLADNLDPMLHQRGYARIDGRLSLGSPAKGWELAVIGSNLTDRKISSWCYDTPATLGSYSCVLERPRSVSFQLGYRW